MEKEKFLSRILCSFTALSLVKEFPIISRIDSSAISEF